MFKAIAIAFFALVLLGAALITAAIFDNAADDVNATTQLFACEDLRCDAE